MVSSKENQTGKPQCYPNHVFKRGRHSPSFHQSSAIYSLGIIGALFYFLQSPATFSAVVMGIIKSIFWPAFVLFKVLTLLEL